MNLKQLYENLNHIDIDNKLKPSDDLYRYMSWSMDGYATSHDVYLKTHNGRELFSNEEVHWISEVVISLKENDSELKLLTRIGDGTENKVHSSSRININGCVEYTFLINNALNFILCSCPEGKEYEIIKVSISGVIFNKAIDLINDNNSMLNEYFSNMECTIDNIKDEIEVEKNKLERVKDELERVKDELERLKATETAAKSEFEMSQQQLSGVRMYIKNAEEELIKTNEMIESNRIKNSELKSDVNRKLNSFNQLSESIEIKENELIIVEGKLNSYKKDMQMFSEDFKAYKEELSTQNDRYYFVFILLAMSGSYLVSVIYKNALSIVDNFQFNFDLWTLFVSRLPIICINIFILGTLSGLIYYIISLITENKKNIAITKQVAYLVKECVDAQSEGLNVSDKEKLKQRVESKMSIIRDVIFISNGQREASARDLDDKKLLNLIFEKLNNLK